MIGGVVVATVGAPAATDFIAAQHLLRPALARPAALVGLFLATVVVANVLGLLTDRLLRALFLGGLNRAAGGLFGVAKGAVAIGFGLLLIENLMPSSTLAAAAKESALARPLTEFATRVFAAGRTLAPEPRKAV